MENESTETLKNSTMKIHKEIISITERVFGDIFDPKEHQGIRDLIDSIKNILGFEIYNSIDRHISSEISKQYRLVIEKLLNLGRLGDFIKGLPEERSYQLLGDSIKETIDQDCHKILELIVQLNNAKAEERKSDRSFIDTTKAVASTGAKVAGDIVAAAGIVTLAGITLVGMALASLVTKDK
ncbi:hypothetical protein [Tolypothrix sp. VBCCA 56010]|uniref:hypothetical protein n=1 Tax=Tolypothrix sp. VBCCA 56010 TaxID=3137731 RepID=UPI003D7EF100